MLADASYGMDRAEPHGVPESIVDWPAVMAAGNHIVRGSQLLRDTFDPGSLAMWPRLVNDSATHDDLTRLSADSSMEHR